MDYLISFLLEELFYRCHIDTVKLRFSLIVFRYWAMIICVTVFTAGTWCTMVYTGTILCASPLEFRQVWCWLCHLIGWATLVCGTLAVRALLVDKFRYLAHLPANIARKMWTKLSFNWFEHPIHCEFSHYDDATIEAMPPHFNPSQCQRGETYILLDFHGHILFRTGVTEQFTDHHLVH